MNYDSMKLEYSDEDKCWVAWLVYHPGIKANGDTPEEAYCELKKVIKSIKEDKEKNETS